MWESRNGYRKTTFYKWSELDDVKKSKSQRRRVTRWFTPLYTNEASSFCHTCRSRKLDLRLLTAKIPDFRELPENPEGEDLDDMESKYAVYINDFSLHEAKAMRLECPLCALLVRCLDATDQGGRLLYMRCVCTLRPRFDRSRNSKNRWSIIHMQQLWVGFQPIEGEVLLDMVEVNDLKLFGDRRRPIPSTVNPRLLRYWLKHCDITHLHPAVPSSLRSRMQTILDRGLFRVINTSTGLVEALTSLPEFVALSYVWGPNPAESKNRPLEGGPISDYAPTIRDAAVLARTVGYEWLWVDRVCIDQASTSDKATLIAYMKDIYGAAQLTIVAACGDSAQTGLLGSPNTPRMAEKPIILGSSVALLPRSHYFETLINNSDWSKRGWTFQEHMFSRRLLFVFGSEMAFSCGDYTFRESTGRRLVMRNRGSIERYVWSESSNSYAGQLQKLFHRESANVRERLTIRQFLNSLDEYGQRNLSVAEDRIAAFAGVVLAATGPMDQASEQALLKHGHPLPFFESLLTWRHSVEWRAVNGRNLLAPSWSWASAGTELYIPIVQEWGDYDQYCWFNYRLHENHNILGLPTKWNAMSDLADLPVPEESLAGIQHESNPGDEAGHSTTAPASTSPSAPKLYLLTLVFEARLVRCDPFYPDKRILMAPESTETILDVLKRTDIQLGVLEPWSIRPEHKSLFPPEGVSSRSQSFETFAIITGHPTGGRYRRGQWSDEVHWDLTIMLLEPTGHHNTYSRMGISRIRMVWKTSYTPETIRKGRPRWQRICII